MHQRDASSRPKRKLVWLMMLITLGMPLCGAFSAAEDSQSSAEEFCQHIDDLEFNGTEANASIAWQVGLGPRVPGSNGSEAFRQNITMELDEAGWHVSTSNHLSHGLNLTNVFARWNSTSGSGGQIVLSAHYDSRSQADQDLNETNRSLPVPGANDGASGVAVLLELARHIPQMNLDYDVVLFLNDAEDQGNNYTLGAEAWADNLTESEINATHAFILLDMIGDADLQLHNIQPGNETLRSAIVEMGTALGMVEGEMACDGTLGTDIIQYDVAVGVIDDHIHPHNLGIPSIDLMDTAYGEPRMMTFGSYWHTMEDTPDKVSAESLEHVGRLVELGLRSDAFFELDSPEEPDPRDDTKDDTTEPDSSEAEHNGSHRLATLAGLALLAVAVLLAMIEFKGKA